MTTAHIRNQTCKRAARASTIGQIWCIVKPTIKYLLTVMMDPRQITLLSVRTMTEIQREFRKAGIEIPYPQLDVHLDGAINQTSQG